MCLEGDTPRSPLRHHLMARGPGQLYEDAGDGGSTFGLVPQCFVPQCFVPQCFVPLCFVPLCFVPQCFVCARMRALLRTHVGALYLSVLLLGITCSAVKRIRA